MGCFAALPADVLHCTALPENHIETSHEECPKRTRADASFNDRPATTETDDPVVGAFEELPLTIGNTTDTSYDKAIVNDLDWRICVASEYCRRTPRNMCCPEGTLH